MGNLPTNLFIMQPTILVLKEGTENAQGVQQCVSNINACSAIVDAIRTTLGPRGMDKLIVDNRGKATISNDGATIMKLLDVVHPAARTLVDIAKSQDAEVGDGTTSVVVLAGEFLKQCKSFIEEGVHPRVVVRGFRKASNMAVSRLKELAVTVPENERSGEKLNLANERRSQLVKCAATAMSSKLINQQSEMFSNMVVDAVSLLDELMPLNMIGIKKVQGGSLQETRLVEGVAFKKTFSYAGFEMQQKNIQNPKIAMLNVKLEKIHKSGAKVVLSKLPIGDVATQWFSDREMFCAGRVIEEDLNRTMKACGGSIQTTVNDLCDDTLGYCELFEETQVGGERFNFFTGVPKTKTCTIILRGGAEQFMEETERSLHDAIMIVRRAITNDAVVAGGGAIEMELSKILRDHSRSIAGKEQLIFAAMARAFECIPRQLCDNAGFDATNILNKLRQKHAQGEIWAGVDIMAEDVADNFEACVWEPSIVKINAITAASEAACLILSVDETVKNPRSGQGAQGGPPGGMPMGRGRGRPMMG